MWLQRSCLPSRLGSDVAIGDQQVRSQLNLLLKQGITAGGYRQRGLLQLVDCIDHDYLLRWRAAVASGKFDVERASRHIACHVLDLGIHPEHLRASAKAVRRAGGTAVELIDSWHNLATASESNYHCLAVFERIPKEHLASEEYGWLPADGVASYLETHHPDQASLRQVGGLLLTVRARDAASAAEGCVEIVRRLTNRVSFLRENTSLDPHPFILVQGEAKPFALQNAAPPTHVLSLVKTASLYRVDPAHSVLDEALELASALNNGSPPVAVAGAWAALESLLVTGEDASDREVGRAIAADRAADICATSWPRAELTTISHRIDTSTTPRLEALLERAGELNKDRAKVVYEWIASGSPITLRDPASRAAFERMSALVNNPAPVLRRVTGYFKSSLRRVYRQRNIVLHGGSTQSVALRSTLQTGGPLVGAALDRIAHAVHSMGRSPLDAAARSHQALKTVGDPISWPLYDLCGD